MPLLPNLKPIHGSASKTFSVPPLDGSLTIPEIYDWHAEHSPDHPLFTYNTSATDKVVITFKQGVHAIHRAGGFLSDRLVQLRIHPSDVDGPVIAIFAASDTVTYFHSWLGLVRAGYVVCHLSTRNSAPAIAHLLEKVGAQHLLVSGESGLQSVAREALEKIGKDWSTFVSEMPAYPDLFNDQPVQLLPKRKFSASGKVCYLHSSGSTAFPKPLAWTHESWLTSANGILLSKVDLCSQLVSFHAIPMFHGLGVFAVLYTAFSGATLAAFKPQSPAMTVSPETTWEGIMEAQVDYIQVAPHFIEVWARDPYKVDHMAKLKGVLYGGGPLNKHVGDGMVNKGVTVYNLYGSTEVGLMVPILPDAPGKDWEYFQLVPTLHTEYLPFGDGTYELVVVNDGVQKPLVLNSKWEGIDAYATSDLLTPHPTKKGYWSVYGRTDDQIMLSTGEKTNPGPLGANLGSLTARAHGNPDPLLEAILCQDHRIQAALMFGRGRFQNGVIIQPTPEYAFHPEDQVRLVAFRHDIWPTVERMNAYAPQHSRLFKEMIMVASPFKPFQYTSKGTIRRQVTLQEYQEEIEALYASVEESTQADIPAPVEWTLDLTKDFVRKVVNSVLTMPVQDENDLFQHGCDSLQATWIRNTLSRALRDAVVGSDKAVPFDLVYANPTISALANFARQAVSSKRDGADSYPSKKEQLLALVEKYTKDFPARKSEGLPSTARDGHVVILTGTTGGLGSALLDALFSSTSVRKVYALNRRSTKGRSLEERQKAILLDRALNVELVDSDKVSLLEVDMTLPTFGLDEQMFEELRTSVTRIIHNAYRVDFNVSLTSFEPQLVIVRNLINFALSSPLAAPPAILFTSSVGVLRGARLDEPAKEVVLEEPDSAIGSGYTESKWVAERILQRASAAVPDLRTIVVRVGQMAGGKAGDWNAAEWLPSLIASGPVIKCLPDIPSDIAWISLDGAANAMLDFTLADAQTTPGVLHLAHPRPIPWTMVMKHVSERLNVPLVPYERWLDALENDLKDTSKTEVEHMLENPALRLLPFYQSVAAVINVQDKHAGYEAAGIPMLDLQNATSVSPSLRDMQPLTLADVDQWLEYWKRVGLLHV
ncbi:acetyl-CoA synthetase-like protein [Punctularia strigosozonata HHB-11173 SS5]|uniref:acetyl-CoA synthetase-like protein n=1 Tax=Punctularia strigosozonata (strain HHB-11173) TaxID=741275 RepID=UPI0004417AA7|nr:acetyl-CoA synthetase-like protein [Punctularia strigosozonata HHB-11173 SS5]EIN05387.1 acetyl-CoA synthetase-like protein [Punctularia strigosozonata HHB-11173 SS5]